MNRLRHDYMELLRRGMKAKGRRLKQIKARASSVRARMIGSNRSHSADSLRKKYNTKRLFKEMPKGYQAWMKKYVLKRKDGKSALRRYRSFIGIPYPTRMKMMKVGSSKRVDKFLVGMGQTPWVFLADGPKGKASKIRKIKGKYVPAFTSDGKNIVILSGRRKGFGKGLKFVGWAPETHYQMSRDMEDAGSHKRFTHWIHKHDDEGGRWPKVYRDKAGNFFYGRSTYRVGAWIRK